MKSAYELAMERLGQPLRQFTDEQKEQLAEIDRTFDAKVAEAKLNAKDRRRTAENPKAAQQVRDDLATELASLERRRDDKKEALRKTFRSESAR